MTVLFVVPAHAQNINAPNPENVLVMPGGLGSLFGRWTATPTTEAAPRTVRPQRVRAARKAPSAAAAAESAPAATAEAAVVPAIEPSWPNAAASVGGAMIVPLTVKTVREMVEPQPETQVVFENELSDIDLAARPVAAETHAPAATDGSGAVGTDVVEQAHILAMGDTMRAMMQSAWLEPLLLMFAGALAALSAVRVFA